MSRLLLISNSTNPGEDYLAWPRPYISDFLGNTVKNVLFIPYAGVTLPWDIYEKRVQAVFSELGYTVRSIYREKNPVRAVENAEAIAVGGGNTFHLVHFLHLNGLIAPIREKVLDGTPYLGWSAGANTACPTMKTTNDMPIIQPASFDCFNLIPFQINPHYLDANPEGHGGETREQRILEFLVANPKMTVAGLREATLLEMNGTKLELKGKRPMRLFRHGQEPVEYAPGADLDFLLH